MNQASYLGKLELELPLYRQHGKTVYTKVPIEKFPYYLKTTDYSDYIRIAVLQKQFRSLFNWDQLKQTVRFNHLGGDDESSDTLDPKEHSELMKQFGMYILQNR